MSDLLDTSYTLPVKVKVKYTSAQDRLLQQIANQVECLTQKHRTFILTVVFDGERYRVYVGENAGIV